MPITYRVERSDDGITGWSTVASGITILLATISSQPVNTCKFYRVCREVADIDEAISNVLKVVILDIPVLTVTGGVGRNHLALTWPSTSASLYSVYKLKD